MGLDVPRGFDLTLILVLNLVGTFSFGSSGGPGAVRKGLGGVLDLVQNRHGPPRKPRVVVDVIPARHDLRKRNESRYNSTRSERSLSGRTTAAYLYFCWAFLAIHGLVNLLR